MIYKKQWLHKDAYLLFHETVIITFLMQEQVLGWNLSTPQTHTQLLHNIGFYKVETKPQLNYLPLSAISLQLQI